MSRAAIIRVRSLQRGIGELLVWRGASPARKGGSLVLAFLLAPLIVIAEVLERCLTEEQ